MIARLSSPIAIYRGSPGCGTSRRVRADLRAPATAPTPTGDRPRPAGDRGRWLVGGRVPLAGRGATRREASGTPASHSAFGRFISGPLSMSTIQLAFRTRPEDPRARSPERSSADAPGRAVANTRACPMGAGPAQAVGGPQPSGTVLGSAPGGSTGRPSYWVESTRWAPALRDRARSDAARTLSIEQYSPDSLWTSTISG